MYLENRDDRDGFGQVRLSRSALVSVTKWEMGFESLKLGEIRRGATRQSTTCLILTLSPCMMASNYRAPLSLHSEEVIRLIRLITLQNQDHLHLRQAVDLRCCHGESNGESTEEVRSQTSDVRTLRRGCALL